MARPLTEHSTKLRTGKGARNDGGERLPARSRVLEPVEGGRLRRIVFEGDEPATAPATPASSRVLSRESSWTPRRDDDIRTIQFEVDNLNRLRNRRTPLDLDAPMETGSVYETERGAIREARQGDRRVLYTAKRTNDGIEERRFTSNLVDMVLAKKNPVVEEVVMEESVEYVPRRRRVVEELPVDVPETAGSDAAAPDPSTYQPQCVAVTKGGVQCRNSAKTGTELCGSHQNYVPASLDDLTDTEPAVAGAEDTRAGEGTTRTVGGKQAQCGAYTKDGMQCRNSSRKSSKYCAKHKGYRAPSRAQLEARLDTKPRWAMAPDTTPVVK